MQGAKRAAALFCAAYVAIFLAVLSQASAVDFGPAQGNPAGGYSSSGGVVTITDALNVGSVAKAVAAGDLAAGSLTTHLFFDESTGLMSLYDSSLQVVSDEVIRWSNSTTSHATHDLQLSRGAAGRLDISDPTNSADATLLMFDSTGAVYGGLGVTSTAANFYAASGLRAALTASEFVPAAAGGLDLGSTAAGWGSLHLGDATAQVELSHDGATDGAVVVSDPNAVTVGRVLVSNAAGTVKCGIMNGSGDFLQLVNNAGLPQWQLVGSTGGFQPVAADSYGLGMTNAEIRQIYLGDAGGAYFGLDQDVLLQTGGSEGLLIVRSGLGTPAAGAALALLDSGATNYRVALSANTGTYSAGLSLGSANTISFSSTAAASGTIDARISRSAANTYSFADPSLSANATIRLYNAGQTAWSGFQGGTSSMTFYTGSTGRLGLSATALYPATAGGVGLGTISLPWDTLTLGDATAQVRLSHDGATDGVLTIKDPNGAADARIDVYDDGGSDYAGFYCNSTNMVFHINGTARGQINSGALLTYNGQTLGTSTYAFGDAFLARSSNVAHLAIKSASQELSGLSGASASTTNLVPAGCRILYVTAYVTTTITGATTWSAGDGSDVDRYGAALALTSGTTVDETDSTADPMSWSASAQDVTLTANGSNFTGGAIRVTAFYLDPTPPGS